jgi:hypothetical protein
MNGSRRRPCVFRLLGALTMMLQRARIAPQRRWESRGRIPPASQSTSPPIDLRSFTTAVHTDPREGSVARAVRQVLATVLARAD